jgi:hypothetical protein
MANLYGEVHGQYLNPELVLLVGSFEEEICSPANRGMHIFQLSSSFQLRLVGNCCPCKRCDGKGHRQSILDIVTRIIVASCQINLYIHTEIRNIVRIYNYLAVMGVIVLLLEI